MKKSGLKPVPKFILLAVAALLIFFGMRALINSDLVQPEIEQATVPEIPDLPPVTENGPSQRATNTPRPPAPPATAPVGPPLRQGQAIRYELMAWNSQMGLMLANGAPETVSGSIMSEFGVRNLTLTRQDDVMQQASSIITCAQELAGGASDCQNGAHFVAVMGDGAAAFIEGINSTLAPLGEEYQVEIVGSTGFSRGEDQFMASPDVQDNPQAARGIVVSAYLRDGDWNIVLKWASDNGIPNNPDLTTYDPNAINWVSSEDFLRAVEQYNSNYCEDRAEVVNGRRTGRNVNVCVNATATWTPGDVNVVRGRGGLVTIASTAPEQYGNQMPQATIGIRKWNSDHADLVAGMLAATLEAGDRIKANRSELMRAAEISAQVYQEEDAAYWARYFDRQIEADPVSGRPVNLGGSYVNNWADVEQLFGLGSDGTNVFAMTYTYFGNVVVQQYPDEVSSFPPASQVFNTRYLLMARDLLNLEEETAVANVVAPTPVNFEAVSPQARVVSERSYSITFDTGRATFTEESEAILQELLSSAAIGSGLSVEIHGHTDNTGNADRNMQLSEERAFAVKTWLEAEAPTLFPQGRVRVFAHGQTQPLASNATPEGRTTNRRVTVIYRSAQ